MAPAAPAKMDAAAAEPAERSGEGTNSPAAPQPATVEPAAAAPGGSSLTLHEAQRRFRELYERCKAVDVPTGRLLNGGGCDIVEIDADAIVIGFQHANMVRMAISKAHEPILRQSVKDVFGSAYDVRARHVPEVQNRLQLLDSQRPSHLLDEALKLGATPIRSA